jgi:alkane 1-monooxygenase|tara:strand:- start:4299 stop:5285 length:987 start_codon:yes stop_codon:yes gene_type:complete
MGKITFKPLYFLSLVIPFSVVIGNYLGGFYVGLSVFFGLVVFPLLDLLWGKGMDENPEDASPIFFDFILYSHVFLQFVALGSFFLFVMSEPELYLLILATLSTGLSTGISGIVVAHELIHRRGIPKYCGYLLLWSATYMHFESEHVQGHHKYVGTDLDPASARVDEGLQYFFLRTVPQQFFSSWKMAAKRNNSLIFNQASLFFLMEVLTLIGLYLVFDYLILYAFMGQCIVAIYLLEYVNYIRHWGLRREVKDRITPQTSWQSNARLSRYVLVELTRHADHHLFANRPYQSLRSYEEAPNLPTGYFGCFYLALIPPIWKRVMSRYLPN